MKAILQDRYGSPAHLRIGEVDTPVPTDEQVLVRVHASSVNAGDWRRVRGAPIIVRAVEGLRRPRKPQIGGDAAGVVEAVGAGITHLAVGDEVFGIRTGAFAEYVAGKAFVPKPTNLTFEQAAAMPIAGVTALQAVRDHARITPGRRVLINGAGGGVGSMAVQIAKAYGATVTAVTGSRSAEMVRSMGADEVIEYDRDDFTRGDRRFDALIDLGGNRSIREMRRVLKPNGRLVLVGAGSGSLGPMTRMIGSVLRQRVLRQRDATFFIAAVRREDLDELRELVEAGRVMPHVERSYPLERAAEAVAHVEEGRAQGKVVITI